MQQHQWRSASFVQCSLFDNVFGKDMRHENPELLYLSICIQYYGAINNGLTKGNIKTSYMLRQKKY